MANFRLPVSDLRFSIFDLRVSAALWLNQFSSLASILPACYSACSPNRCAEVLEVEGKNGKVMSLRVGHDRSVGHPEIEVCVPRVELGRTAEQDRCEKCHSVFTRNQRFQEEPRGVRSDPAAQQMIRLHDHRINYDQVPAQFRDESGGKAVCLIPSVRRRDERPRIGDDPQREATGSRRYCSASLPRSRGPCPEAT